MKPEFKPEDVCFLKTDTEALPRICTSYKVTKRDIIYELSSGPCVSWHYGFEISKDKPTITNTAGFGRT